MATLAAVTRSFLDGCRGPRGLFAGFLWLLVASAASAQPPAAPALSCAVEAAPTHSKALDGLCGKLGVELARPVQVVEDVRRARAGQGVQVIETDFSWYVVLLEAGKVRAFTRISLADARGREVSFVARAFTALSAAAPKAPAACLRVDPARAGASSDVVYPWAELVPCTRTVLDVRDPWWEPNKR